MLCNIDKKLPASKDSEISIGTSLFSDVDTDPLRSNVTRYRARRQSLLNSIATSPKCTPGYTRESSGARMASIAFYAHTESYLWEASSCWGGGRDGSKCGGRREKGAREKAGEFSPLPPLSPAVLPSPPPRRARASRGYGFITRQ